MRCKDGWLSVRSSSGNNLLESLKPNAVAAAETDESSGTESAEALVGEADVESWSDLWPSSHANSPQAVTQQRKKRKQADGPAAAPRDNGTSPRFPRYAKALKKQAERASFARLADDDQGGDQGESDVDVVVEAVVVESEDDEEEEQVGGGTPSGRRSSRLAKRDAPDSARASRAKRRRAAGGR